MIAVFEGLTNSVFAYMGVGFILVRPFVLIVLLVLG